jgi:myo-inositol-1-phosphate synthase
MADKNLEALIVKIVKKEIKKEIKNLNSDNLPIVATEVNQQLPSLAETFETEAETRTTAEILENIYTNRFVNLPTTEDLELERKLRELKFKQELRKDWILFLLKDVIVYAATILFMFTFAGFYLLTLIHS